MKAITRNTILALLLFLVSCDEKINRPIYEDSELEQYVRFALLLDDNGVPIAGELGNMEQYASTYSHEIFDTILVPVSLTSTSLDGEVSVSFSNTFYGDDAHKVSYEPDSILTFSPNRFYDTISVIFNERWFSEIQDSIVLKLEKTSDPAISIGYPFNDSINDQLTIHLKEINFPITVSKPNTFVLTHSVIDTFDFYIEFENGFIYQEIDGTELLIETENNLDYTLVQHPFLDGDTKIYYSYILNTPVPNKFEDHSTAFELAGLQGYKVWGSDSVLVSYTGLEQYSYTLSDEVKYIEGNLHENAEFYVVFSSPLDESIIDYIRDLELIDTVSTEFDFTLTQQAFNVGDDTITYVMELQESLIEQAGTKYTSILTLADIEGFTKYGTTEISFIKQAFNDGDNSINPAAHFYNDSYPANYKQLFHYMWIEYNGSCKWNESFQMCYPVKVEADHPNAVLHNDGNYYHAFRFGFDSPNLGRTTNSFGLKRLFDNEYTDADKSPGFNIPEALELYPKDGTSHTEGNVAVIEQELTISSKNDNSFTFSIAGEGTYYYDEGSYEIYRDSIFTIELKLEVTSEELFGGTRVVDYMFKNRDLDKADMPDYDYDSCEPEIDLNTVN